MGQKRPARRGRGTVSSGSKDSLELGRDGEYRPAKKPSTESDRVREGSESTDAIRVLAAMARATDGTTKPPEAATAEPTSSSAGAKSTSRRQEEVAKKLPPPEDEEEEEEEESEEEWTEASGPSEEEDEDEEEWTDASAPNPQPERNTASCRVTRSQQRKAPAPAQHRSKETPQPSEPKKPKSKKIAPAPLQQQLSKSEMRKSKITTTAPLQQQGEENAQPSKSKRIRRIWTPSDEVQILTALVKHRRKQGKLPAPDDNGFFDSILKRLVDKSCNRSDIKDKVRSLMRRHRSYVAPTTPHEQRIADLSQSVWGDLPAAHAANGNNGDGEQDEGEHAMPEAENNTSGHKSFEEMCDMYPLLAQEVKRLAGVQPALTTCFTRLEDKRAVLMEKKLGKLKWKELKIQAEMEAKVEAPKARIRNQLVNVLLEVSKK